MNYYKPVVAFAVLYHHLGYDLFLSCLQEFITRWAYKAPTPYDLFYTFENVSNQDLSWWWRSWFFEFGTCDIGIESFEEDKLVLKNLGQLPISLIVDVTYNNGKEHRIEKSAKLWTVNDTIEIDIQDSDSVKSIFINKGLVDNDNMNNMYPTLKTLYDEINRVAYTGSFARSKDGLKYRFQSEDDMLYINVPKYNFKSFLIPIGGDSFRTFAGYKIEFVKDADGIVIKAVAGYKDRTSELIKKN